MTDQMTDQSVKILKECSSGCKMAIESMEQVSEFVVEKELAGVIQKAKQDHETIEKKVNEALMEKGACETEPPKTAKAFAYVTTEMKMMLKSDSRQAAKIMMDGCNMGIQSIMEVINKNPQADQKSIGLAQDLVKAEEKFVVDLKPFL